jgi:signal transduction histidine kinase/ligand-binding sensor domain-containing protein/AraC-like DNA-binding protein
MDFCSGLSGLSYNVPINMKRSILVVVLLSATIYLFSQSLSFNQLTIGDGLSSGNVTCILQDSRGFMWFGTDDGLNKYDGYQVTIFRHNPQLPNSIGGNSIRCLFEDSKSNLWIGLKGSGLCKLNLKSGQFKTYKHSPSTKSISYNDVAGIIEDRHGRIWIAVDRGGLDLYKPATDDFEHFPIVDKQTKQSLNNALTDIKIDKSGTLWLSSWGGGIYCFDTSAKSFSLHPYWRQSTSDSKVCQHIYSFFIDTTGVFWIASGHGGLYSLDNKKKIFTSYVDCQSNTCIPNRSITAVNQDISGKIWVSTTNNGIYIIHTNGTTQFLNSVKNSDRNLLADNNNCIYTDKTGIVWIGTPVGVNYYSPLLYQFSLNKKEQNRPSLSENQVLSLLKDQKGNVWVGEVNTINKISGTGAVTVLNPHNGNNFVRFNALHEDESGTVWIGGYANTLIKCNPLNNAFSYIKIPAPEGTDFSYRNLYDIYEDWDRTLWLATELGVINYNPVSGEFKPLFESGRIIYPEDKSHIVFRDQDLELWVGTENGLKRFDRYNKYKCTYTTTSGGENSIINNFITAVYEDKKGIFWIGTMGGLHRFDKKSETFQLKKRPEKIYGDPVFGICQDSKDNLWISTTSEIIKVETSDNSDQAYNASDGLQSKDFQLGACFQATDGELFFGGKDGFNSFYPEKLIKNDRKPNVVITDFLIFNRSVTAEDNAITENYISETETINIKHKQSVITFKFSALNYISPEKNKYTYKLEGFDKDWTYVDAGQRSATYTNLNSGEYIFKVKATNNDGVWNDVPTEIKLYIHPPFWRTWYAYLFYLAAITGMVYLVIRYFTLRAIDRNNLRLARIEAERMKEIDEMKVNLFTNVSHEFRTPLSLILGPITQIMEKERYNPEDKDLYNLIYRNAQRLLRLINQLLDFRKIESGKLELNLRYDNISKFIQDVTSTFSFLANEKNIHFEVNILQSEIWMDFDSDKMDKILYNLISNAFHYTPEGGYVHISVDKVEKEENPFLEVKVNDTGIGMLPEEKNQIFMPFYQGKRQKEVHSGGSGIGLALTKELVDLFHGSIEVESEPNEGSTFTLLFPVAINILDNSNLPQPLHSSDNQVEVEEKIQEQNVDNFDLVLVVEDNHDMQLYIKSILSDRFKVELANNGKEGLDIAIKIIPDLIISDIMMPVKDGIEMVKDLKQDDKTSHIPLILLTSRHEESQVVEGYELGVDDYITKPFSAAILKARIQNILVSRKKSWEQYQQSENLADFTEKLSEDPRKQNFINKINTTILSHIEDPNFGIEQLADELKMSVNQMFRKVKALMDTTPYNVIVQVRMTHAAQLIRKSDYNISEIAFLTGYQELSNFSRSFKKFYTVSPREYLSKYKNS